MPVLIFPKGSVATLAGTTLSEHNRSALDISNEEVKSDNRTVSGLMRRYFVASKRKFSLQWNFLPALDGKTVDGKAGRNSLKSLYTTYMGTAVTFTYKEANSSNVETDVSHTVFIDSYQESLIKRWDQQYWNVQLTLVEQ